MTDRVSVNSRLLTWAIARAGYDLASFTEEHTRVGKWIAGQEQPTIKQLEDFSKKVYVPFGYLFLSEPPREEIPIPFFRTAKKAATSVLNNINVYDTILMLQQRQDWLREYWQENDRPQLAFVGKFSGQASPQEIVEDIRRTLGLAEDWAIGHPNWEAAVNHLVQTIGENRIIAVFNGVVGNNTRRKLPPELRGFVLVDEFAPFLFVNNSDYKTAQMFTLAHELAHVWIGKSAAFDLDNLLPANDPTERLCDQVAAEFLVPAAAFARAWQESPDNEDKVPSLTRVFKVSELVIARRALDLGYWDKPKFQEFYQLRYGKFAKSSKKSAGGNFYATESKRISPTFAANVQLALRAGHLSYREAYKLTGMKGETFDRFFAKFQ
jgi:Zn-dependent peptidase ImmA (M78 family)